MSQDQKLVMITGASSGIGKACALEFARNGYNLILTARRIEKLEELKAQILDSYNVAVHCLKFDVRSFDEVKKAIDANRPLINQLDILINNAGLAKGYDAIHEGSLDHWETMIDTNIKGLLYVTKLIAPIFVNKTQGHIINTASTAGHEVYPKGNVYCATKHAVDALTKSMRLDLHEYNIRVSQISPGHVEDTEFAINRFDGDTSKSKIYEDFIPLNSSDVAEIIYFIASRKKHINIQDVLVMGTQQANSNFINRSGR